MVMTECGEYMVRGKLSNPINCANDVLFTPNNFKLSKKNIMAADALYFGPHLENQLLMVRIINPMMKHNVIYKGTKLGCMSVLSDCYSVNMFDNTAEKTKHEIIQEILDRHVADIGKMEYQCLKEILNEYKNVFSQSSTDVGNIKGFKHEIDTGNECPIALNPRRVPIHVESKVDELVKELEKKNIIEKTSSSWNFPIVVVPKKNGEIRMCIDYRQLNALTKRPVYYIPDSKQLFDCLEKARYFSSLDLSMGYHQISMNERDIEKTAFVTRTGQYAFKRMPFGLCGAPQSFQRVMASILREQNWKQCVIYLDDILIFGNTLTEHNARLRSVLQRLFEAGVKLSPLKCSFMKKEIKYLGHLINEKGLQTDPGKIDKIKNWPLPITGKQLHTFISLCGYYRKFVKNFAEIVRPLELLLHGNGKGKLKNWTSDHTKVFESLKRILCSTDVLAFPRKGDTYVLDTDACHESVGAVLSQIQNGEERVISYASHALSKHEKQYCVTRKELLAVYKYVKYFQHYLFGQKFIIRTDHRALTWMLNWKKPSTSQYCAWIAELELYDFMIEHRKGESHTNADAMSRYPHCEQCPLSHEEPRKKRNFKCSDNICAVSCKVSSGSDDSKDDPVRILKQYLNNEISLETLQTNAYIGNAEFMKLWKIRKDIKVSDNGELQVNKNGRLLIIPEKKNREEIINNIHKTFGHPGMYRTKSIIKDDYFWYGMELDINLSINRCVLCQQFKHKQKYAASKGNLQAYYPFEKVSMDISGPFKATRSGHRYIFAMIDNYTKYPVLIPLKATDSESIVKAIFERWISVLGSPESLHSDRGSNLNSNVVMRICKAFGIRKTKTTPYFPQGDGVVERLFRTVKPMIGIVAREREMEWNDVLPIIEMGLRNSRSRTTGFTPNQLLFGKNMPSNGNTCMRNIKPEKFDNQNTYVENLLRNIKSIQQCISTKLENENEGIIKPVFKLNSFVWIRKVGSRIGNTLFEGPYKIIKQIGRNAYRLVDREGEIKERNGIHLKPSKIQEFPKDDKRSNSTISSISSASSNDNRRNNTRTLAEPTLTRRYPTRVRTMPQRFGFNAT